MNKTFFTTTLVLVLSFGVAFYAFAFIGPGTQSPGTGGGLFYVSPDRNIGFGTVSPEPTNTAESAPWGYLFTIASSSNPGISLFNTGGGKQYVFYSHNSGALGIHDATAGAVRLRIAPNGRVAIGGITAPDELFHVFGTAKANLFTGDGSALTSLTPGNVSGGAFAGTSYAFPGQLAVGSNTVTGLPANGLVVAGRVGIGNTSPDHELHISATAPALYLKGTSGGDYAATVRLAGESLDTWQGGYIQYDAGGNNLIIGVHETANMLTTSDIESIIIRRSDGNVGIKSTSPTETLTVNGTFSASGNWSLGGAAITDLNMDGNDILSVNKISVTAIDPLYSIDGIKYSTYVSSIAGGIKEEFVGRGQLTMTNDNDDGGQKLLLWSYVIDFNEVEVGSDLWLWHKTVDFSRENVEVLATPYKYPVPIAYEIEGNKIIFHTIMDASDVQSVDFSFRLVGKRVDWRDWPTFASDQSEPANIIIK